MSEHSRPVCQSAGTALIGAHVDLDERALTGLMAHRVPRKPATVKGRPERTPAQAAREDGVDTTVTVTRIGG